MQPRLIQVREPEMGAKAFLIEQEGLYVLAMGPGVMRGIACTHAGTGALIAHDGVPNGSGFFENRDRPPMAPGGSDEIWKCPRCRGEQCPLCFGAGETVKVNGSASERLPCPVGSNHCLICLGSGILPDYWSRNGRHLKRLNQMGMWMLDAGFHHGLTIAVAGGTPSVHMVATITWIEQNGSQQ